MARQYWLMKSEPYVYSIDDLQRDGTTYWDGVRNYAARQGDSGHRRGRFYKPLAAVSVKAETVLTRPGTFRNSR